MPLTDDLVGLWAVWDGFGSIASTRHCFAMVGPSPTLKQDLMAEWLSNSLVILLPIMSNNWTLERLYVEDIVPGTAPAQDYSGTLTQAGGSGSGMPPGQVSIITTWLSDLSGRANRGRTYWPGTALVALEDGLLTSSALVTFDNYAGDLLARWGPGASLPYARFGTLSRQENGVPRGPVLIETTGRHVRQSPGTQRRRRSAFGV